MRPGQRQVNNCQMASSQRVGNLARRDARRRCTRPAEPRPLQIVQLWSLQSSNSAPQVAKHRASITRCSLFAHPSLKTTWIKTSERDWDMVPSPCAAVGFSLSPHACSVQYIDGRSTQGGARFASLPWAVLPWHLRCGVCCGMLVTLST